MYIYTADITAIENPAVDIHVLYTLQRSAAITIMHNYRHQNT